MLVNVELDMYPSAPDHPVAETGEVYGIYINYGFVRCVTLQDKMRLEFWKLNARNVCRVAMLATLFLWITSKDPTTRKQSGPRVNVQGDSPHI